MTDDLAADEFTRRIATDWRTAGLAPADAALCALAVKLTKQPDAMTQRDISTLRNAGFSDEAILDAVQVVGYFNYINRVADALGVEPEPGVRAWEEHG
ncbi:MAG: peroxidase [Gemmatimonadetes bacterium]|nr:peroxidase [Gemmatimonadota bacterium]